MRFHGKVGFGDTVETSPGVHEDSITEFSAFGEVVQGFIKSNDGENLNKDVSVSNMISIIASREVQKHALNIRYLEWEGVRWSITSVEFQPPRLLVRLGEVYNGPTP